ncbi:MAG: chemotaxis protein CheX [Deltaproteobacteria bacterium]|nr:chemotaxis protein CheX [Deltaproteobacteria bacterium]OQX65376.1 MAG: hypothetical protein B5M55_04115 [Desulfococcus sp. 4484_242]
MGTSVSQVISQVGIETFEKLAFMFAFPKEETGQPVENRVSAGVVFRGPFSGRVIMHVSDTILPELAANMLGLEDEGAVTLDQQYDALKETLNIVCGNLLPAIAGEEPVFHVEMPCILSGEEDLSSAPEARVGLELDEGECEIALYVDQGDLPKGSVG